MGKSQYQYNLKHYQQVYGVSYRTILRWSERGFPLDDIEKTKLLAANKSLTNFNPSKGGTLANYTNGALGLNASIQRLQEEEAIAHANYKAAVTEGDELLAGQRRKAWQELVEQLRKTEQTNPEVAEANKQTVQLGELKRELNSLFINLRQDLETLPRRIALELVLKDEIAIREIISKEANHLITNLYKCKFLGGLDE